MEKKNWEPCPRCGSNRVQARGTAFLVILGFCLIGISIWLLIIPPVGIAGMLFGILLIIVAPLAKGNLQCQDCNFNWKYPYEENERRSDISDA